MDKKKAYHVYLNIEVEHKKTLTINNSSIYYYLLLEL